MDIEKFSYTILTAIIGMLVVFFILAGLSLMILLIRKLFSERARPNIPAPLDATALRKPNISSLPDAVVALAAAAYLQSLTMAREASAHQWQTDSSAAHRRTNMRRS